MNLSRGFDKPDHLPAMPFYEKMSRVEVARMDAVNFHGLVERLKWITPKFALKIGDRIGAACVARTGSPYAAEIAACSSVLGTGVFTLNTGYEWACTAMVREAQAQQKPVLHRVLDWSLPMGKFMHVARYETARGPYYDINWAGNSGMINGAAKDRFVISINQSPIPMRSKLGKLGFPVDWLLQRRKTFTSNDWLPSHLLRHVFETAPDFATACDLLENTPLAIPVIFTICGTNAGEHKIIERMEHGKHIIEDREICTANHWQKPDWSGHPRPIRSRDRLDAAKTASKNPVTGGANWEWLVPPILNRHSIMAFIADTDGLLQVVNFKYQNGQITPLSALNFR